MDRIRRPIVQAQRRFPWQGRMLPERITSRAEETWRLLDPGAPG